MLQWKGLGLVIHARDRWACRTGRANHYKQHNFLCGHVVVMCSARLGSIMYVQQSLGIFNPVNRMGAVYNTRPWVQLKLTNCHGQCTEHCGGDFHKLSGEDLGNSDAEAIASNEIG